MEQKRVTILGSTGSIGTQAIEVAQENGFRAERLQDGEHYDYLARLSVTL